MSAQPFQLSTMVHTFTGTSRHPRVGGLRQRSHLERGRAGAARAGTRTRDATSSARAPRNSGTRGRPAAAPYAHQKSSARVSPATSPAGTDKPLGLDARGARVAGARRRATRPGSGAVADVGVSRGPCPVANSCVLRAQHAPVRGDRRAPRVEVALRHERWIVERARVRIVSRLAHLRAKVDAHAAERDHEPDPSQRADERRARPAAPRLLRVRGHDEHERERHERHEVARAPRAVPRPVLERGVDEQHHAERGHDRPRDGAEPPRRGLRSPAGTSATSGANHSTPLPLERRSP